MFTTKLLGFLVDFIPLPIISGFTSAGNVHPWHCRPIIITSKNDVFSLCTCPLLVSMQIYMMTGRGVSVGLGTYLLSDVTGFGLRMKTFKGMLSYVRAKFRKVT